MNRISHLQFVTIHPSDAQHDAECPDMGKFGTKPKPTHFRVSRPEAYEPPRGAVGCPGYKNPAGREGHYTDACCATQAARIIGKRLLTDVASDTTNETLDVQVWR